MPSDNFHARELQSIEPKGFVWVSRFLGILFSASGKCFPKTAFLLCAMSSFALASLTPVLASQSFSLNQTTIEAATTLLANKDKEKEKKPKKSDGSQQQQKSEPLKTQQGSQSPTRKTQQGNQSPTRKTQQGNQSPTRKTQQGNQSPTRKTQQGNQSPTRKTQQDFQSSKRTSSPSSKSPERTGQSQPRAGSGNPHRAGQKQSPSQAKERDKKDRPKSGSSTATRHEQKQRVNKGNDPDRKDRTKTGSSKATKPDHKPIVDSRSKKDRNQRKVDIASPFGRRNADSTTHNKRDLSPTRLHSGSAKANSVKAKSKQANRREDKELTKVIYKTKVIDRRKIHKGGWSKQGAWAASRPWKRGWYAASAAQMAAYPGWQWWNTASQNWGTASLPPAAEIYSSVDTAVNSNEESILVQNTDFKIFHDSVKPLSDNEIEFYFQHEDSVYLAKADCEQGLLNEEQPSAIDEAELMHAACTIAFSPFNET
jgi:hypothetical protein